MKIDGLEGLALIARDEQKHVTVSDFARSSIQQIKVSFGIRDCAHPTTTTSAEFARRYGNFGFEAAAVVVRARQPDAPVSFAF